MPLPSPVPTRLWRSDCTVNIFHHIHPQLFAAPCNPLIHFFEILFSLLLGNSFLGRPQLGKLASLNFCKLRFDAGKPDQHGIPEFVLHFFLFSQPGNEHGQQFEIGFGQPVNVLDDFR